MNEDTIILLAIVAALYFTPSIIAEIRYHHNKTMIWVANTLLGWTLIGWVACFIYAFAKGNR